MTTQNNNDIKGLQDPNQSNILGRNSELGTPIAGNSSPDKTELATVEKPHLWKKGQSGNPGGRPKGLERRIRDYLESSDDTRDGDPRISKLDRLMRVLFDVATNPGTRSSDRVAACKLLFERHSGAPKVQLEVKGEPDEQLNKRLETLSPDQLRALALLDAVDITPREGKS